MYAVLLTYWTRQSLDYIAYTEHCSVGPTKLIEYYDYYYDYYTAGMKKKEDF